MAKWDHLVESDARIRKLEKALAADPGDEDAAAALADAKRRVKPLVHPWLMTKPSDDETTRELKLITVNDNRVLTIHRAIRKKMAAGRYSYRKAPKLWLMHVDKVAKDYAEGGSTAWHIVFPIAIRRYVAAELAKDFEDEEALDEHLIEGDSSYRSLQRNAGSSHESYAEFLKAWKRSGDSVAAAKLDHATRFKGDFRKIQDAAASLYKGKISVTAESRTVNYTPGLGNRPAIRHYINFMLNKRIASVTTFIEYPTDNSFEIFVDRLMEFEPGSNDYKKYLLLSNGLAELPYIPFDTNVTSQDLRDYIYLKKASKDILVKALGRRAVMNVSQF